MIKFIKRISIVLVSLAFYLAASASCFAQSMQDRLNSVAGSTGAGYKTGTVKEGNVADLVGGIINTVLSLLGVIFLVLIVYAGYLWLTASGNDEQVAKAKKLIRNSVIGIAIVLSSYIISYFVVKSLMDVTEHQETRML